MPWYRIFASHGPGHQSSTEFYRWYEQSLDTEEKKKAAWEAEFDNGHYFDWPIGDVELCGGLPQNIFEEKVEGFKSKIQYANRMLEVLRTTKVKPVIAVRFEIKPNGGKPITGHQARLLAEPTVVGPMKPSRDEAVDALLSMFRRENRKIVKAKKGATRHSRRQDYAVIVR